jgi:hypothetical protein
MRYTDYTATLPTRTTLRETATRTLAATSDRAAGAAVALAALLTFATGATTAAVALGVVLTGLPGHPVALLAAAATVVVAARAVPMLALLAARVAARTLERSD